MPVHGIDHVELYVGNAAQAAYYFTRAFGFTETAYAGLETGRRDRVSHVLEQGRIRLVLTGTLLGDDEIAAHHAPPRRRRPQDRAERARRGGAPTSTPWTHGARGVHDAALGRGRARARAALLDRHVRRHAAPVRPARGLRGRRSCPASSARGEAPDDPDDLLLMAIDHIVGNVELGHMEEWVGYYERVFGMTEMIHFSDEAISTEYSALMSKVVTDGSGRHQVPDQRARRGQAQVADRGVHRVLPRRRRPAHRRGHPRHRGLRGASCASAASSSSRSPTSTTTRCPSAIGEIEEDLADLRRLGHPGRPRRRGLPAADLHQAGRRPPDGLLRDHRAPRLARLRRGQLQGPVRGDRARAGPEREPLMRYASLGKIPAKRHVQVRRNGERLAAAGRGGHGLRGLLGQRVDPAPPAVALPARRGRRVPRRSSARSGCRTLTCTGWPTPTASSRAATRCRAGAC